MSTWQHCVAFPHPHCITGLLLRLLSTAEGGDTFQAIHGLRRRWQGWSTSDVRIFSASMHDARNKWHQQKDKARDRFENKGRTSSNTGFANIILQCRKWMEFGSAFQGLNTWRERTKLYMHPSASSNPCFYRKSTSLEIATLKVWESFWAASPQETRMRCYLQSGLNSPSQARHHSATLLQPRPGVFRKSQRTISWSKINSAALTLLRCFESNT